MPAIRWIVTVAATAASTYALDLMATACGVVLATSHLLDGLDHATLIGILAVTYVVWAFGLRTGLHANAELLEQTDVSTNALSKLAWDLTRSRSDRRRARRLAAALGYLAIELLKEVPYYLAAVGAALVSDSIEADDALVFLAGANLGAAGYEYVLGRSTCALLARRVHASFDTDWVAAEYLAEYYRVVEPDERRTIAFFVEAMRHADPGQPVLVFGTGPTLHHVFLAARDASEIHLADYLPENLREIRRWLDRDPGAHDWRPFVEYTLQCEGIRRPSPTQMAEREELTRTKLTSLIQADGRFPHPVDRHYATVISAYCADSATADHAAWQLFMQNILGLVRPGGTFLTAALRRCHYYLVGGKRFPSAHVDEHDLQPLLDSHFATTTIETHQLPQHASQGYSGIVLAASRHRIHQSTSSRTIRPDNTGGNDGILRRLHERHHHVSR